MARGSNYDGIISGAGATEAGLVWDSANKVLWYDDWLGTDDAGYRGVVANFNGNDVTINDVFAQGVSITDSAGYVNLSGTVGNETLTATVVLQYSLRFWWR